MFDGIDFFNPYIEEHAEEILDYSDWMAIPIIPHEVTLDRFKEKLLDALHALQEK